MSPDELLRRYPGATLRWLRGQQGLSREAFAARLRVSAETVAGWETLGRAIAPAEQRRILPLLARHLATPEGEAFVRSLHGEG
jgi:DNA-binding transcriptional regulator YiaG